MASDNTERNRMIIDMPPDVQLAIRLRAVKTSTTTGSVVCQAVQQIFAKDVEEARIVLAEQSHKPKETPKRTRG